MDEDRDIRVGLEVFVTETSAADKLRNIFEEKKRQQEEFDRSEAAAYQRSLDAQRKFLADQKRLDAEALAARRQMFGERMALQNAGIMSLADAAREKQNAQSAFEGVLQLQRQFNAQRLQLEIQVQRDIQVLRGRELEMFRAHIAAQVAIARAGYSQMRVMRLPASSSMPLAISAGGAISPAIAGGVPLLTSGVGVAGGFNYGAFANAFWAAFQQRFGNRGGGPPLLGAGSGMGNFGAGGGPPVGGFTPQPFNWGAFIQGANLGQNSLNALTGTISNLQMIAVRLAFTGFRVLIGEITATVGIIYKLSESFLQINEKFAVFQIMLTSILKNATQAMDIRSEITRITATSPIPFEGIAELVKSLAIIPGTRAGLIQQAQSGNIQDPNGFLQKSIQLVEQMLTFRPDKKVEDAIFSIREAMSGEFRSLVRRFDIPLSAISAYSGVPTQELKKDPQKVLGALEALFNQLVDPEAVKEAAKQPSKLFQNIWEQIFINPILALGSDTTIKATGKSLYDSILAPFQTLLRQATDFSRNKTQILPDFSVRELAGSSPLAQYAQQAAEPLFSMFTKALKFLGDTLDKMLGTNTRGMPMMDRIAQLIVSSLENLERNFVPMMERAKKVLTGLFDLLHQLAMAVAGFLNTFGETIANHPYLSLLGVSAVRGVTTDVIRTVAGGAAGAFNAGALQYMQGGMPNLTSSQITAKGGVYATGGMAAVGAGMSSLLTGLVSTIVPLVLTAAVVAAIYTLVDTYRKGQDFNKEAPLYARQMGGDVSAEAVSPYPKAELLNTYADIIAKQQAPGIGSSPMGLNYPKFLELKAQSDELFSQLQKMGIPPALLETVKENAGRARELAQQLTKSGVDFEASYNVALRNMEWVKKFQDEQSGPSNIFSRTPQSERQFPLSTLLRSDQVGFDTFKGESSPEVDAALTKLTGKENPLEPLAKYMTELSQHLKIVDQQEEAIQRAFQNKLGLQEEMGRKAEEIKKDLDALISHGAPDTLIGEYQREYESLITLTTDGTPLKAAVERVKGYQKEFLAFNEGKDKQFAVALAEIEAINKEFTNFSGDPEQARSMAEQLGKSLELFGMDKSKTETFMKALTSDVAEKGLKASDREEAAGSVARVLKQILDEMVKHLETVKQAAFVQMQQEISPLQAQTILSAPGNYFLNRFLGKGDMSITGPSNVSGAAGALGSLLRGGN